MRIFLKEKLQAPAESEGGAEGAPAGEDASLGETEGGEFEYDENFDDDVIPEETSEEAGEAEADAEEDAGTEEESDDSSQDEETEEDAEGEEDSEEEAEADEQQEEVEAEAPAQLSPEDLQKMRDDFISQTAEGFQFSEEEAEELRVEPEKALPKILAKVQVQALESAVQIMRANLPELVRQQLGANQSAMTAEKKFYGKFPELKSKEAVKVAEGMAKAYRSANPDATLDEVIDNVGYMTWRKMGLPLDQLMAKMGGGMEEEFTPATRKTGKKAGFKPEQAGRVSAARTASKPPENNEFAAIADALLNDDNFDVE